jgi:hypothetical protein
MITSQAFRRRSSLLSAASNINRYATEVLALEYDERRRCGSLTSFSKLWLPASRLFPAMPARASTDSTSYRLTSYGWAMADAVQIQRIEATEGYQVFEQGRCLLP